MTWFPPASSDLPLRFGDHGPAVEQLQFLLEVNGCAPGHLDGIFGPKTEKAVQRAEVMLGLQQTSGLADLALRAALHGRPRRPEMVERVMTPTTWAELAPALRRGYERACGTTSSRELVLVAGAMLAEEHGANYTAVHMCNLGNHQVRRGDRDEHGQPKGPWFSMIGREVIANADAMRLSPYPAFADLDEGAEALFEVIAAHYAPVLPAFEAGDPARAACELKATGWFTGELEDYIAAMVSRFGVLGHTLF